MTGKDLSDATVGQLLIQVTDLDRATEFYRDKLGCRFLFSAPPQMSFYQTGNVRLLVAVPEDGRPAPGSMLYFKVTDIEGIHATLRGRGVEFLNEPRVVHRGSGYDLWLCEFRDPDGNPLALMEERPK